MQKLVFSIYDSEMLIHRFPLDTLMPVEILDSGGAFATANRPNETVFICGADVTVPESEGESDWIFLKMVMPRDFSNPLVVTKLQKSLKEKNIVVYTGFTPTNECFLIKAGDLFNLQQIWEPHYDIQYIDPDKEIDYLPKPTHEPAPANTSRFNLTNIFRPFITLGRIATMVITIPILLLSSSCHWFFPWREFHDPDKDLPWNGPNSRPVFQERSYPSFSTTGTSTDRRWYSSFTEKPDGNHYGRIIDRFLEEKELLETFPKGGGSAWYGGDVIEFRRAPYEFNFFSINPLIASMTPLPPEKNSNRPMMERKGFVMSKCLDNHYYYSTKAKFTEGMLLFSPDLDILPEPLVLDDNGIKTIEWADGRLVLAKQADSLISRREGKE